MDMDVQHMQNEHGCATWTWACSIKMDMLHGYRYAAWAIDMYHGQGHAA
jgi:hypothetical protein